MPFQEDFRPDPDGLREAVARLVTALMAPGVPHADPGQVLDLPAELPEEGLGGRGALQALAGPALEQVSRLDHLGFLAHMDPPTPGPAWAAAMWGAAVNQNLLHPDTGPAARLLEPPVGGWLAPVFGMGGGHLGPGST